MLSDAETRVVSALLADAWGPGTEIRGAEPIWGRKHVMRLRVTTDRSVVLKRRGEHEGGFGAELAALEYLNAMPLPVAPRREAFLSAVASLGLDVDGADAEIDELSLLLNGTGYLGLVYSDACPDNVRFLADSCRIFDFETSGWGPIVLDAACLLAPFPSCWCFAGLSAEVAAPAMGAYRAVVRAAGIDLGPDWDVALTAALAVWFVGRGEMITRVLGEDEEWGTTMLRPRLLTWSTWRSNGREAHVQRAGPAPAAGVRAGLPRTAMDR